MTNKEMLDMRIEWLNLSVRPYNCLKRCGINTIEELCNKTPKELRKVRNLGVKGVAEITGRLKELGLSLKQEVTVLNEKEVREKASEYFEALKRRIESEFKYHWHNLVKDPYDLPEVATEVLVKLDEKNKWYCGGYATAYFNPVKRSNFIVNNIYQKTQEEDNSNGYEPWDGVVAWRYIEPFEED